MLLMVKLPDDSILVRECLQDVKIRYCDYVGKGKNALV